MEKHQKTVRIDVTEVWGTVEELIEELTKLKEKYGTGSMDAFIEYDVARLTFSYGRDETEQESIDRKNLAERCKGYRKAAYENLKKEFGPIGS